MHITKRIISILLVLAICILAAGCGNNSSGTKKKKKVVIIKKRPTSSASETVEEEENSELETDDSQGDYFDDGSLNDDYVYISERDLAEKETVEVDVKEKEYTTKSQDFKWSGEYKVVYPDKNEQLRQSANKLASYLTDNKIKASVVSDKTAKTENEILLGDTNRKKSKLKENQYAVSVSGKQLFFESGNFNGVVKAVSWFISLPFKKGKVNTLNGEYEFSSKVKRPDGTYTLVWSDEFDGNVLDSSKWELTSSISAESSFKLSREPEALTVEDGLLKLTALRWFDPDNNQIQAIAPYTVESKEHMNFQYGYLEMRARIPFSNGAWPSLWLSGACKSGAVVSSLFDMGDIKPSNFSAEIDIVEYTSLQPNLHKWFYDDAEGIDGVKGIVNKHSSLGAVEAPVKSDLHSDPNQSYIYQTIGFDITPEEMTVYINGEVFYNYNWKKSVQLDDLNDMTDFLNPLFIRINNHLLPKNIPSDYSTLPCEFFVDYVRLYQKPETGGLWLAE